MKNSLLLLVGLVVTSIIINIFFISESWFRQKSEIESATDNKYQYLARRIFLAAPNNTIINFIPLRQQLQTFVANTPEKVGIFVEYLPTGVSVGLNDREPFFQASLIKTPTVMSIYKLIELGKLEETQKLTVQEKHVDPNYGQLWQKGDGYELTVEEAARLALVDSDNTAFELLSDTLATTDAMITDEEFPNVYDFLNIPVEESGQNVTPRNYSSILKSLFFSAYLSFDNSNKLLDLLSQSTYKDGIRRGVPETVRISHKFGLRKSETLEHEVHSDCGIVYIPLRPYILCVMIQSDDIEKTATYMGEVSKMVYEYIESVNVDPSKK